MATFCGEPDLAFALLVAFAVGVAFGVGVAVLVMVFAVGSLSEKLVVVGVEPITDAIT